MTQQTANATGHLSDTRQPSRRFSRRWLLLGSAAAAVGLGGYAFGIEPQWVVVEHHDLPIPGLPQHLENKSVVQISDLHIGSRVSDSYLIHQLEYVQSLHPDFVLFTGDFLDRLSDWHLDKGKEILRRFPHGKIGTACVLGNHDFAHTSNVAQNKALLNTLVHELADQGLNLLQDEVIEFSGLKIAGLRDYWHGGFQNDSARKIIERVSESPAIVLSHNPDTVDLPIWSGYSSWVLCGHTHGGQCRFPFIGAPFLPVKNKRYVAGHYAIEGGHQLYINRGLGHLTRVRFNARPEITAFTLKSA